VSGYLLALLGVVGGLSMAAIGDMMSEEARDRLDHLPRAILRLAARRLNGSERLSVAAPARRRGHLAGAGGLRDQGVAVQDQPDGDRPGTSSITWRSWMIWPARR
jgi:hypothetical protein